MKTASGLRTLVISMTPTHPQTAGNRAAVFSLLTTLRELGHEVHFLYLSGPQVGDQSAMRTEWGTGHHEFDYRRPHKTLHKWRGRVRTILGHEAQYISGVDDLYDPNLDEVVMALHNEYHFNVVISEYIFQSKALELFDACVLKIIDTHDIFANRHKLFLARGEKPSWLSTTPEDESMALSRSDIILAKQDNERDYFESSTGKRVITFGHIPSLRKAGTCPSPNHRLLFVGSDSVPNRRCVEMLTREILPRLRAQLPGIKLLIAGEVCKHVQQSSAVVKRDVLEDMNSVYTEADIVLNPVDIGTGLKIKNLEAMGYGKPLVTTSVGADGLESGSGSAFHTANTPEEFVQEILHLISNPSAATRLGDTAFAFATKLVDSYRSNLANTLSSSDQAST